MHRIPPAAAGPFRVRDVHYAPGEVHPRHTHDVLQISIVLRGSVIEDSGGNRYHGTAGDVVVKPPGVEHANVFEDTRIICLDAHPDALEFPMPRYVWHRAMPSMTAAMRLVHVFHRQEAVAESVDDLLATIPSPVTPDRMLAKRARCVLDDSFAAPLDMQAVARHLGVHRVYLARVFRLQWGCSPRDYVQRLRVRAAAHAVASSKRALADVALDAGFADQSHMNRIFARTVGMTPAALRRLSQA